MQSDSPDRAFFDCWLKLTRERCGTLVCVHSAVNLIGLFFNFTTLWARLKLRYEPRCVSQTRQSLALPAVRPLFCSFFSTPTSLLQLVILVNNVFSITFYLLFSYQFSPGLVSSAVKCTDTRLASGALEIFQRIDTLNAVLFIAEPWYGYWSLGSGHHLFALDLSIQRMYIDLLSRQVATIRYEGPGP